MSLSGKTALVTGSTSGIGLGIARVLASQGADVVLNGFGNVDEIETLRAKVASEFGVRAIFSAADLSRHVQIGEMVEGAAAWIAGHSFQQRRHSVHVSD